MTKEELVDFLKDNLTISIQIEEDRYNDNLFDAEVTIALNEDGQDAVVISRSTCHFVVYQR